MNEKEKILRDYVRMCNFGDCDSHCDIVNAIMEMPDVGRCSELILKYPEKAVELVEKWSKEHPERTYLTDFLAKYPNARLDGSGTPFGICVADLGIIKCCPGSACNCKDCWNTPVEE